MSARQRRLNPYGRGMSEGEAKQVVAGIARHIAATSPRPLPGPDRIAQALKADAERSEQLKQYLRGTSTKENR